MSSTHLAPADNPFAWHCKAVACCMQAMLSTSVAMTTDANHLCHCSVPMPNPAQLHLAAAAVDFCPLTHLHHYSGNDTAPQINPQVAHAVAPAAAAQCLPAHLEPRMPPQPPAPKLPIAPACLVVHRSAPLSTARPMASDVIWLPHSCSILRPTLSSACEASFEEGTQQQNIQQQQKSAAAR
jgi:hypothetical protein